MQIANLDSLCADSTIETDLAIVGGGPAGLTIAHEFLGTSVRVLVLREWRAPRGASLRRAQYRRKHRRPAIRVPSTKADPTGRPQLSFMVERSATVRDALPGLGRLD